MITSALIIILVVLLYILFTPITIEVGNDIDAEKKTLFRIRIFPFGFFYWNGKRKAQRIKSFKRAAAGKPKKNISKALFEFLFLDWTIIEKITIDIIWFCCRLIRCFHDKYVYLSLTGGLREPHLTGQMYSVICAIYPILPESIRLTFKPDFSDDSIHARYHIEFTFFLSAVLIELFRLLFRLPLIKMAKMIWKFRKENQHAYQN